jgi:hypothetical protein
MTRLLSVCSLVLSIRLPRPRDGPCGRPPWPRRRELRQVGGNLLDGRDLVLVDAEIGRNHLWIVLHGFGVSVGDLLAIVEHHDVVGDFHNHAHVVFDQQDGGVMIPADILQQLVQFGRFARVEAGGRLVQAQKVRPGAHRPGDFKPSLVTIGQIRGRVVGPVN